MNKKHIFITINHLDDFNGLSNIKVGDSLTLIKDLENHYDDEAIAVFDNDGVKIGYVANSIETVARGTYSAGRLYDLFDSQTKCAVLFMLEESIISELYL